MQMTNWSSLIAWSRYLSTEHSLNSNFDISESLGQVISIGPQSQHQDEFSQGRVSCFKEFRGKRS